MKTFTASQFRQNAGKLYIAALKDGACKINNSRYPDEIFILTCTPRRTKKIGESG